MRVLNPNHDALFGESRLPFGAYAGPMLSNTDELSAFRRRFHRKSWLFLGHFSKAVFVGFAIADAGYAGNAFAYVFLPGTGTFVEQSALRPFAFSSNHQPEIDSDWRLGGFKIKSTPNSYRASIQQNDVDLTIEIERKPHRGVSFVCPSDRGHVFTFKNVGQKSRVYGTLKGEAFDDSGDCGSVDFSNGFPPRVTRWKWGSVVAMTATGKSLCANVVSDHNGELENVVWLNGDPTLLPAESKASDLSITSGTFSADFEELGSRGETLNLGVVSHDFTQSFGPCSGSSVERHFQE